MLNIFRKGSLICGCLSVVNNVMAKFYLLTWLGYGSLDVVGMVFVDIVSIYN